MSVFLLFLSLSFFFRFLHVSLSSPSSSYFLSFLFFSFLFFPYLVRLGGAMVKFGWAGLTGALSFFFFVG